MFIMRRESFTRFRKKVGHACDTLSECMFLLLLFFKSKVVHNNILYAIRHDQKSLVFNGLGCVSI